MAGGGVCGGGDVLSVSVYEGKGGKDRRLRRKCRVSLSLSLSASLPSGLSLETRDIAEGK